MTFGGRGAAPLAAGARDAIVNEARTPSSGERSQPSRRAEQRVMRIPPGKVAVRQGATSLIRIGTQFRRFAPAVRRLTITGGAAFHEKPGAVQRPSASPDAGGVPDRVSLRRRGR